VHKKLGSESVKKVKQKVGLVGLNWGKHKRQVTKQSRSNRKAKKDTQKQSNACTWVKPSNTNRGNSIWFKEYNENKYANEERW
jgi:hypothetical protein